MHSFFFLFLNYLSKELLYPGPSGKNVPVHITRVSDDDLEVKYRPTEVGKLHVFPYNIHVNTFDFFLNQAVSLT